MIDKIIKLEIFQVQVFFEQTHYHQFTSSQYCKTITRIISFLFSIFLSECDDNDSFMKFNSSQFFLSGIFQANIVYKHYEKIFNYNLYLASTTK